MCSFDLELLILLTPPPESWYYRYVLPFLDCAISEWIAEELRHFGVSQGNIR